MVWSQVMAAHSRFEVDAAFEFGAWPTPRQDLALAIERWLLRRFDRVSAISQQMVSVLNEGSRRVPLRVVSNWVDTKVIYPFPHPSSFRSELGIAEDTLSLCIQEVWEKNKGSTSYWMPPGNCRTGRLAIVFCGEGPYRQFIFESARLYRMLLFLLFQPSDRLNDLLNLADIHLLPQRADAAIL